MAGVVKRIAAAYADPAAAVAHRGDCPCCTEEAPVRLGRPQRRTVLRPLLPWRVRQAQQHQSSDNVQDIDV